MQLVLFFGILLSIYLFLYSLTKLFKSCLLVEKYSSCLRSLGISIDFLRLRWHTRSFSRSIRVGSNGWIRGLINKSFTLGVVICFLLLPLGIILLIITIFGGKNQTFGGRQSDDSSSLANVKVEILLPGINLPLEELGYYLIALLISTLIHEWGHALAAILEDVPVTGFGIQLYFCLPLAYTELSADHLNALKWFRKLRIICAGVWHNFLFGIFCYFLLSTFNFTASPLYDINRGVIVTELTDDSPMRANEKGLYEGNIITQINDCKIINEDIWYQCLFKALRSKTGYCITSEFINFNDESIEISHHAPDGTLRCCDEKNEKLCCFEYVTDITDNSPIEIPQHVCLNVRNALESASNYCISGKCDVNGFCLRPLLRNLTTICTIKRTDEFYKNLKNVIYIGNPIRDIARTVRVSNYIPKQRWLGAVIADVYILFLKYNVVFSIGLALVNVIPCFGFDGYHITSTIINSFLVNRVTERPKRDVIALIIAGFGTLLFAVAFLKVFLLSLSRNLF